jgi:predicted transcriptional regulator
MAQAIADRGKKEKGAGMTQDEIIEMAREVGCPDVYTEWAKSDWSSIKGLIVPMTLEQLVHCAKLVAAKEREACAKVCDFEWGTPSQKDLGIMFAQAIRARGEA